MKIMKSDRMEALARKELNQKEFYDMYKTLETNKILTLITGTAQRRSIKIK